MRHSIPASANIACRSGDPRACYERWRAQLQSPEGLLLVDFEFAAYWQANPTPRHLAAIYYVCDSDLQVAVTDQPLVADDLPPGIQFLRWTTKHRLVSVDPTKPVSLEPDYIAKPWGQEIWYTGVELRAVCHFARGEARSPIPWLRAVLPADAAGAPEQPMILLKILDPSPEPATGDLYFELHETKREVYVVTHIDLQAWPDGVGYIRYGFDPGLVASFADEDQFRQAYLEAVQLYEAQRRALDAMSERGAVPEAGQLANEQVLRERMDRFTHLRPLRAGDVVQVPLQLPHALQHGVRVVEFQSATYERKILSFGQKVQTQAHWDTAEVVAQMRLAPPVLVAPEPRYPAEGVIVENIVEFPDFEVLRATVQPGFSWQFETGSTYCLVMVISGLLDLMGARYEPERALLLPRSWVGPLAAPEAAPPLVFLLARPRP